VNKDEYILTVAPVVVFNYH